MALKLLYLALKLKDLAIYRIHIGIIMHIAQSLVGIATATKVIQSISEVLVVQLIIQMIVYIMVVATFCMRSAP